MYAHRRGAKHLTMLLHNIILKREDVMLQLKNIVKDYHTGDEVVQALKGVSVNFRRNEFVSILGQSGCGKTTLLNIVGGLDQYTSGDLVINGKSTKNFKSRDWDSYRNNSVGFVFQSYNLIPHQSVLSNVELALTLSGVSKAERRKRAKEVLEKVGLENQIHKKPNQMSGGQMQRVAIARALINDPDILLADEPTSDAWAISAASLTSSSDASGAPNLILDAIVPENRIPFCGTKPIFCLTLSMVRSLISCPSIVIEPSVTS